jgi:cell division protein ZapA
MKRTVDVSILGQKFRIKSEESEDYVENVARYVDSKVKEATVGKTSASIQMVLLAAMNIADDLFRNKRESEKKIKTVEERISNMIELIEEEGSV